MDLPISVSVYQFSNLYYFQCVSADVGLWRLGQFRLHLMLFIALCLSCASAQSLCTSAVRY